MRRFLPRPAKRQRNRASNFQYREVPFSHRHRRLRLIRINCWLFNFFPPPVEKEKLSGACGMIVTNSWPRCFMYFGVFTRSDTHSNNSLCVYLASHNLRNRIIHVTYWTTVEYEMTHATTKQHVCTSHAPLSSALYLLYFLKVGDNRSR